MTKERVRRLLAPLSSVYFPLSTLGTVGRFVALAFEKLLVCRKSVDFADEVCAATEQFPRGYGFLVDRLNRAAISIAANIAEGNGRFTRPDRRNFFGIARGSVQERVMLSGDVPIPGVVSLAPDVQDLGEIPRRMTVAPSEPLVCFEVLRRKGLEAREINGMASSADKNLLVGILALQMDFIHREQLIAAMNAWVLEKSKSLDAILREQGALGEDTQALLQALVEKHLELHAGDVEKSLASLSSVGSLRENMKSLADPDIAATISAVAAGHRGYDPQATNTVGTPTSSGSRFRILRPHAKGGLGVISVARDDELHREVALKEIQSQHAHDSNSRARFVMEAEITGCLEHPGIVPVYGLGQYGDGRPFYAMRFIRGDSLKDAVDAFHRATYLSPSDRSLELRKLLGRFVDVCQAIEYAHSRGVLHRDLKPGNIMLGKYGETLVVDWGLAKAVGRQEPNASGGEATLHPSAASGSAPTQMGMAIGTPAYMSPEQASGQLDKLGPASDVYSLGATLYHVLTGQAPFGRDDLPTTLRKVQTGDFPKPHEVNPLVARPLEAICLKAMSLQREDRYPSPAAVAEDVEKWLADEPVRAYAEPLTVRTRRWLRKHPKSVAAVTAAVLVGITSLAAIATVVANKNVALAKANSDLRLANTAERKATKEAEAKRREAEAARAKEQQALAKEEEARKRSETVSQYLVNAFRRPDPSVDGREVKVAEVLDQAVKQIDVDFKDHQPVTKAGFLDAIGRTYRGLGLPTQALEISDRAYRLFRDELGEDDRSTVVAYSNLALSYHEAGQPSKALPMGEECFKRSQVIFGETHPQTLMVMNNLAIMLGASGDFQKAVALHQQCLKQREATLGKNHEDTLGSLNNLAAAYAQAGDAETSRAMFQQSLERMQKELGEDHPATLNALDNLAIAYKSEGQLKQALPLSEKCLEKRRKILGPDHPQTLNSINSLAMLFEAMGQFAKAVPLLEECLEKRRSRQGDDHPATLAACSNLAFALESAGHSDKALPLYQQTAERHQKVLGDDHPQTLQALMGLASAYSSTGRLKEALPIYEKCFDRSQQVLGRNHPTALAAVSNLAFAYWLSDDRERAIPLFEECLKRFREVRGNDHPETLILLNNLATAYSETKQAAKAIPLLMECLERRRAKLGDDNPATLAAMNNLAMSYAPAGEPEKARPLLQECFDRRRRVLGENHPSTLISQSNLANAYELAGDVGKSIALAEDCLRRRRDTLGSEHPDTLLSLRNLAVSRLSSGDPDQGESLFAEYLTVQRSRCKDDPSQLAMHLGLISIDLLNKQRYATAERYLREGISIREKLSKNRWSLFYSKCLLGSALAGQKRYEEAESLLLEGYEGMTQSDAKIPIGTRTLISESAGRLLDLYTAWNKPDEAAKWKAELDKRKTPVQGKSAEPAKEPAKETATQTPAATADEPAKNSASDSPADAKKEPSKDG